MPGMSKDVSNNYPHENVEIVKSADWKETSHELPTTTRSSSNGRCFIDILADDVLLKIFLLLYSIWNSTFGEHRRRSELAVCRRWRLLALGTPLLWQKVSYPEIKWEDRVLNTLSFERSKQALLELTVNAHALRTGSRRAASVPYLLVRQHSLRFGSLRVFGRDIEDFRRAFLRFGLLDTPQLRAIRITGTNVYSSGIPTDADHQLSHIGPWQDISSLITLTLIGVSPFQFPSAANLRCLHISSTKLTTKGLQDLMRQFPVLESLAIDKVHPWYNLKGAESYSRDTIYLPTLRKLALGTGRKHDGKCLCAIGCIAAPNLEILELRLTPSALNDDHLSTILRPENSTYLRKVRLAVAQITLDDIPFLSTLPPITELETPQLDQHAHNSSALLVALLEMKNFHSITIDIHRSNMFAGEFIWSPRCHYIDKRFFRQTIAAARPTLGSPLRLRGQHAHVNNFPPEVQQVLGPEVRKIGLFDGEPWIVPGWDALQLFDFADRTDDDAESEPDVDTNTTDLE